MGGLSWGGSLVSFDNNILICCGNKTIYKIIVYLIFSINLVSQVTLRSSGTDILYGCHLLRRLYNILY
jgi:hypothetical protein